MSLVKSVMRVSNINMKLTRTLKGTPHVVSALDNVPPCTTLTWSGRALVSVWFRSRPVLNGFSKLLVTLDREPDRRSGSPQGMNLRPDHGQVQTRPWSGSDHGSELNLTIPKHAGEIVFIPRIGNQPGDDECSFKFTRRQFPVRLCFFMTINKSQGQSVEHVGLDLRSSVFTHGQFYVGISRVTSVERIKGIWNEDQREAKTHNIVYPEVLLD